MTRAYLFARATMIGLALGAALASCSTPQPVPVPPTPTPADPFAGAIVDCSQPEAQAQEAQVRGPVSFCLVSDTTSSCLRTLADTYRVDSIACGVRQVGIDANVHVLAGAPTGNDTTIDNAARAWLVAEKVGFR